jgi:hypothetical protein
MSRVSEVARAGPWLALANADQEHHQVDGEGSRSGDAQARVPSVDSEQDGEQAGQCGDAVTDEASELVPLVRRV